MQRTWIMVAFVDLRGFGTWIYRASIPNEIKEPFIQKYYEILQDFVVKRKDVNFKYLGDGFLAIREFTPKERTPQKICGFIKDLKKVTRRIIKVIKECEHPPDGVRVRITEGYAYKIELIDPHDYERKDKISEFVEYSVNTAERLMEVNPEILCLATEDVVKALGPLKSTFRVRKLGTPSGYPKSVNKEDIESLEVLKF